jgi:hypothetical protein
MYGLVCCLLELLTNLSIADLQGESNQRMPLEMALGKNTDVTSAGLAYSFIDGLLCELLLFPFVEKLTVRSRHKQ